MKQTVFLFMFFLLISCSNRDINGDATISNKGLITFKPDYENDSIKRPYPIDNFIDSIKYLKLEFSEESLIGDISSLEVYKDHIYIMDMQTQSIFIYTMEGKFIKRIHSVGNGPKEYTQIDYFSIDKNCDHLIVSDLMGYWVIRYDLKGNFINRTKIPFWIDGIYPTENKGYILFANKRNNKQYFKQEFSLYIVDSLMKIKKKYFPYNSDDYKGLSVLLPANGGFYTAEGKSHFYSMYLDTTYQLSADGLVKKYAFDFGKLAFNRNLIEKNINDFRAYFKKCNYMSIIEMIENDNFVYYDFKRFNFILNNTCFYNKKTNNSLLAWGYYLNNQLFWIGQISTYKDFFVTNLPSDHFCKLKFPKEKSNSSIMQIRKIQENYSEEDNPIIVFFRLKNF